MNFKTLMVIKAIVCLCFSLILLAIPGKLYSLFGTELSDGGIFAAREYAAAMGGILFVCWIARNAAISDARTGIITGLFVYDLIGVIISILAVISGVLNPLGWLIVLIYLFFTLGFGYFLIKSPAAQNT